MTSYKNLFELESIGTPPLANNVEASITQVPRRLSIDVIDWVSYNTDYVGMTSSHEAVLSLTGRVNQLNIDDVRVVFLENDLYRDYYSEHLLKTVNEIGSACRLTTKIEYSLMA